MNSWLSAMRLRTLPLSIAGIITGGGMAYHDSRATFDPLVFILAILTALILQILSNFANDYGDFENGADNENRKGPLRAVQSGAITARLMKRVIIISAIMALLSGLVLLYVAFANIDFRLIFFLLIGVGCIAAALKYTMGSNPYGYKGLGDVFVFIFFGLVSSCGTYYLLSHTFPWDILLPSISIGAWSTAVLNLNNLRDMENDQASGKITIPVRIGKSNGLRYQFLLMTTPFLCNLFYALHRGNMVLFFFMIGTLALAVALFRPLFDNPSHGTLDRFLKKTALFSLLFTLLFLLGMRFN